MPLAPTAHGALYFEVIDRVLPWEERRLPILFHHGIGASSAIWAEWLPLLGERHPLVTFEMRGYGRSHIPAAVSEWSLDVLVADVFAVAEAAGIERFHLVGESIGGTIALAAVLAKPERIATLTISNGAHLGASIERVDAWKRQLDEGGVKHWSDIFMRDRFHDDALAPAKRAWFAAQQEAWPRGSILEALGVLIGTDLSPRLSEIRCPVLLLHPDASPFIPVPIAAELHRLLPTAELQIFGHARHGLPFSHGRECAAKLRDFLARTGAR